MNICRQICCKISTEKLGSVKFSCSGTETSQAEAADSVTEEEDERKEEEEEDRGRKEDTEARGIKGKYKSIAKLE